MNAARGQPHLDLDPRTMGIAAADCIREVSSTIAGDQFTHSLRMKQHRVFISCACGHRASEYMATVWWNTAVIPGSRDASVVNVSTVLSRSFTCFFSFSPEILLWRYSGGKIFS